VLAGKPVPGRCESRRLRKDSPVSRQRRWTGLPTFGRFAEGSRGRFDAPFGGSVIWSNRAMGAVSRYTALNTPEELCAK